MSATQQPNTTLYVNNLNDQVQKDELRAQLFALFATYGRLLDVVALKTPKMRGQAFLVFSDLASATSAMRALEGMVFYDKPMHIDYAKSKSHATARREDPDFVPPKSAHAHTNGISGVEKRAREDDGADISVPSAKREKPADADDDDDEEMEIDDEEEAAGDSSGKGSSARLLCTNLPQEVTDDVLSVLFQQYQGFQSTKVSPPASGQKTKTALVVFESAELAGVAKEALDGFALKKGANMGVAYT